MRYTVTKEHFQYHFGERRFTDEEKWDLKKFLEFVKAKIQTNALVEKAFATAGNADTWISIAHAFGMKEYTYDSTSLSFFEFLFEQHPVLTDYCTITWPFHTPGDTFYLNIRMYYFDYKFGLRDSGKGFTNGVDRFGRTNSDVDLDKLKQFLGYAEQQIQSNALIKQAFETVAEAKTWILIAQAFGMTNFTTPITFFQFLFQEYSVLNEYYIITKHCERLNTFIVGTRGQKFEIAPGDMVL